MKYDKNGYTLLFAVIVSSIVLSIATFILSISRKQFILSSAARDSTIAIYAADSGIQCVVKEYNSDVSTTSRPLVCNGVSRNMVFSEALPFGTYEKKIYVTEDMAPIVVGGACARIKIYDGYTTTNSHKIIIESRGYNIGDATNCPIKNSREEERAIQLIYQD